MKNKTIVILLSFITVFISSCEVIGGIFKGGVWTGVILVVALVLLIVFIISRMSGKK